MTPLITFNEVKDFVLSLERERFQKLLKPHCQSGHPDCSGKRQEQYSKMFNFCGEEENP